MDNETAYEDHTSSFGILDFFDDNNSTGEDVICEDEIDLNLIVHLSVGPAVLIILMLSFFQIRTKNTKIDEKIKVKFCQRRFGFVVPLDLTEAYENRWTYGFAFGAIANKIIVLFQEGYLPDGVPPWAKGLGLLAGALEVGLVFYPIFACLTTDNRIFGSIVGFLYSLFWLMITLLDLVVCPHETIYNEYEKIISTWPSLLSFMFLLGRFLVIFILRLKMGVKKEEDCLLPEHQEKYVKRLLRKPVEEHQSWFKRKIFSWDPYFKFPNRILGTTVLTLFCLYIFITSEWNGYKQIMKLLRSFEELLTITNDLPPLLQLLKEFADGLEGVWFFTTVFSSLVSVFYVVHILVCYRRHIKLLWVGDKSFLPAQFLKPSPAQNVASIAKYSGLQVAYILWGYMIMHLVQICVGMLFFFFIVLPIKYGIFWDLLKDLLILMLVPFLIVFVISTLQIRLAEKFFLQDKIFPNDNDKPLALNNRKAFQNFSYFLFFYNVIVGFGSSIKRLVHSLVFGSLLIGRIDRTLLPRGFETMDTGHKTWIGMLYVDLYHNNPVLKSFCYILLTTVQEKDLNECVLVTRVNEHKQARTRWFLFYTLLRNPRLRNHRKHQVEERNVETYILANDTIV
ncbi:stimulated by retinoic acid gene 6 protein-like [Spea bombifrons]|uniref:stimulated by retinoic acid gene 6 protein-like n=1 Tax=Spea bombifrons TaxID=233779 RepID=UPI00234B0785|nr:stimulated by retinoic acid gene 6 protein-like [Spea bombifrons]